MLQWKYLSKKKSDRERLEKTIGRQEASNQIVDVSDDAANAWEEVNRW